MVEEEVRLRSGWCGGWLRWVEVEVGCVWRGGKIEECLGNGWGMVEVEVRFGNGWCRLWLKWVEVEVGCVWRGGKIEECLGEWLRYGWGGGKIWEWLMWGVVEVCKGWEGRLALTHTQPPQCNRCLQGKGNPTPGQARWWGGLGLENIFRIFYLIGTPCMDIWKVLSCLCMLVKLSNIASQINWI